MKSRAGDLLRRLVGDGTFTRDELARELVSSPLDIDAFLSSSTEMPLPCQLSLADLVIARAPRLARSGHALRGQVLAAMAFRGHVTAVHREPPTSWMPSPRRRII